MTTANSTAEGLSHAQYFIIDKSPGVLSEFENKILFSILAKRDINQYMHAGT